MKLLLLFIILISVSCATIERDIYFRDKRYDEKSYLYKFPGKVARVEGFMPESHEKIYVSIEVKNASSGSYLFGIILPILPVFFLPGNSFSLNSSEALKLTCSVVPIEGSCKSAKIQIAEKILTPSSLSMGRIQHVEFDYDVKASDLHDLKIIEVIVEFPNGKELILQKQVEFVLEDWTRYYSPRVAP